jgi:signal transduction histidine kinase
VLDWAAEDFESRTGIRLTKKLPEEVAVDADRATALFRILQETLTNVALHSGATEVSIELAEDNGVITLQIHDNGRGISDENLSARESLGILGMRERAALLGGELIVDTAPGHGTTVRVRLPQSAKAAGATGP